MWFRRVLCGLRGHTLWAVCSASSVRHECIECGHVVRVRRRSLVDAIIDASSRCTRGHDTDGKPKDDCLFDG